MAIDSNLAGCEPRPLLDKPGVSSRDKMITTEVDIGINNVVSNPIPIKKINEPQICKIIKVFNKGSEPKPGSPLYFPSELRNESSKPIVQAIAINITSRDQFIPFPANVLEKTDDEKYLEGLYTYVYDEDGIVQKNLTQYDEVEVVYTTLHEAKIISVRSQNNGVDDSSSTSPLSVQGGSTGETLGSSADNTLGEVEQPNPGATNITPDGPCGNGSSKYPFVDCKSAAFDVTGQVVTLHPVFWDTINNLFNEIYEKENKYKIYVTSAYRTKKRQYAFRTDRCPAALTQKQGYNTVSKGKKVPGPVGGEEWLMTAPWGDVISNFNCRDTTAVGAAKGPYASNHLKGLAVDLTLDVPCKAKNKSKSIYERCLATSKVYKIVSKYSSKYGISNLVGGFAEVWHWSWNGH